MQTILGIIINQIRYSDHSNIVRIFCHHHGMKTFLVRTGKKTNKNLIQPLTIVEFEAAIRENLQLQSMKNLRFAKPLHNMHFDPIKSAMVMFIDELLYKTIPDDYVNNQLFKFLNDGIILLDDAIDARNFHIWFLLEISRHYGFYPTLSNHSVAFYLDIPSGFFVDTKPNHPNYIEGEHAGVLAMLLDREWPQVQSIDLHSSLRRSLLQTLVDYIRFHLENVREIKSLQVLHEVFHD
jgi:DNA repair protein RecO (recombination protein O)